jgi:cytochrome b pre-mRNA-processing protein 3
MFRLFAQRTPRRIIEAAYGAIVAQARSPGFYAGYHVPDTVEARFDMIVLHLALVLRRLRRDPLGEFGQRVFDLFCLDMDRNLREMGVSDLAVPRHMRRVGEAFYGRANAYDLALAGSDEDLAATLARNIFALAAPSVGARRLTAYMRAAEASLAAQDAGAIGRGELSFPDPDKVESGEPGADGSECR